MSKFTVKDLFTALRTGKYTSIGSYPTYFVTHDSDTMCHECARKHIGLVGRSTRDQTPDGWRVIAHDVNWEDWNLHCAHCGKRIESAYAEDEVPGKRFKIVRHFQRSGRRVVVKRNQPLSLAKAHCKDLETSSSTCTKYEGKRRTRRYGAWFDSYTEETK